MKRVKGRLVYKTRHSFVLLSDTSDSGMAWQGFLSWSHMGAPQLNQAILHNSTPWVGHSLDGNASRLGQGLKLAISILPHPPTSSRPWGFLICQSPMLASLLPESILVDMFADVHGSEYRDGELEGA